MNIYFFSKHLFITTLSGMMLFSFIYSESFTQELQKPEQPVHPQLKTDIDIIEYDTIVQYSNTTRRIKVANKGNAPLQVYNVRSSSGVTVPSWPRQQIEPGEEAYIQVRYNSSSPGPINRKIIIHSNSPENTKIIKIRGYVIPAVK